MNMNKSNTLYRDVSEKMFFASAWSLFSKIFIDVAISFKSDWHLRSQKYQDIGYY